MAKHSGLYVKSYKHFITFLVIIISIAVLVVGIALFSLSRNSLESDFNEAFIDDTMQYELQNSFYITLDGNILNRYYYNGDAEWSKQVYAEGLSLCASDRLIAIYDSKTLQVLTSDGEYLYSTDVIGTINHVECSQSVVAVFSEIIEENGNSEDMIYFYNTTGSLFDSIDFEPEKILDFGFSEANSLWVLTIDPTNVVPVSRIITYNPGVSMTGLTTVYSELVEQVFFSGENMFVATTTHLLKYNLFGEQLTSIVIYDWQIKSKTLSPGSTYFAAIPRAQNESDYYTNVRILTDTTSTKVNLPQDISDMLMLNDSLYIFGTDIIYVYSADGVYQRQYQLNEATQFIDYAVDNRILVKRDNLYYFLLLP